MTPLSPEAVAQMVADREAGTPGPVVIGFRKDGSAWLSIGGLEPGQSHSQGDIFFHKDYPRDVINANRFMRLPDLEAAYLALAAENATLRAERDKFKAFGKKMVGYNDKHFASAKEACRLLDIAEAELATLRASEAAAQELAMQWSIKEAAALERITELEMELAQLFSESAKEIAALTPTADKEPKT